MTSTTQNFGTNPFADQFTDELFDRFNHIWNRIVGEATNVTHFTKLVLGFADELVKAGRPVEETDAWRAFALRKVEQLFKL
jgi:hypothetical protein